MRPYKKITTLKPTGFTLVELIGVLVIIAILSAAVLPSAIDIIRVQRAVNEAAELPKVAEALKLGILREQMFPIFENDPVVPTLVKDGSKSGYWWNLASRHGGGSASEVRYPIGIRPGDSTTRKLYYAEDKENTWGVEVVTVGIEEVTTDSRGRSFFEITGDGRDWLDDFQNPTELRLLLLSTTNPDLPLPDDLDKTSINNLWEDWAVGSNGDPATGTWGYYGLDESEWKGRAAELNIERIDLRDLLCTVIIENRLAVKAINGADLSSEIEDAIGFWDRGTVLITNTNLRNAEFILQVRETTEDLNKNNILDANPDEDANDNGVLDSGEDLNGNGTLDNGEDKDSDGFFDHPAQIYSYVDAVIQSKRGQRIDNSQPAKIIVSGRRFEEQEDFEFVLPLTDLAPVVLINPNDTNNPLNLNLSSVDWSENRYFLRRQEILLGDPWFYENNNGDLYQAEVGIFTIIEPFSTLRFDGEKWNY